MLLSVCVYTYIFIYKDPIHVVYIADFIVVFYAAEKSEG